jgi:hypothetical protein
MKTTLKINVKQLTIKEVKSLSVLVLKNELNTLYDLACNIDYLESPIESDVIQRNITLIESVLIHREY